MPQNTEWYKKPHKLPKNLQGETVYNASLMENGLTLSIVERNANSVSVVKVLWAIHIYRLKRWKLFQYPLALVQAPHLTSPTSLIPSRWLPLMFWVVLIAYCRALLWGHAENMPIHNAGFLLLLCKSSQELGMKLILSIVCQGEDVWCPLNY